ncbi:cytochrome P450 [Autumnicola edwardsiae]|uniref:Cytochrome P450 n=1 Tax=Autumnicola edwardsiae TaxID=3075594 RepID=A0ABU3CZ96_9FLAO|nr:cytochrome P450 [Zunongwangia sp. F297]MDT0651583.1 cytochrome P450 [Zunongwangia sp. F297]
MANIDIPTVSSFRFLKNANLILRNPLPFHRENFQKLGDIFQVDLGFRKNVIFCRDAHFAEYVLKKNHKNYHKSTIQTEDMAKYLGHGLLTTDGEQWRKQRRMVQPAFHKKQLAQLLDSVDAAIKTEIDRVETGKAMDIFPIFNDLAFQTVVKSLFSSAAGQEEINILQYITEAAQKMLVKELRQPFKGWWFKLSGKIKHHLELTQEAREILKKIVAERRQSGQRQDDLLDMLLDARYEDGEAMSEKQLIDEILILFTAGHETTSNALTFTTKLLANHPEVQDKISSEVKEARANSEDHFEFLKNCTYTSQVVEESMRLYPPVYFIDRVNLEDDEFNGIHIPKNSSLLFSLYEIHRNEEHWKNPEEFNPDRFEGGGNKHEPYYFPFGAGPRKCIGNNFAMYEMIMTVAELVSRFKISAPSAEIEIQPLITLKPKNAIVEFTPR